MSIEKIQEASIELARKKREYEKAEAEFQQLIVEFAALVTTTQTTTPKRPEEYNYRQSIEACFETEREKEWDYKELHKMNLDVPIPTLRAVVSRLGKEKKIHSVGRGKWKFGPKLFGIRPTGSKTTIK